MNKYMRQIQKESDNNSLNTFHKINTRYDMGHQVIMFTGRKKNFKLDSI